MRGPWLAGTDMLSVDTVVKGSGCRDTRTYRGPFRGAGPRHDMPVVQLGHTPRGTVCGNSTL